MMSPSIMLPHIPPLSVTVIVEHSQGRQFYAEGKTDDFESFASRRNIKARIKNLFKLKTLPQTI